MKKIVWICAVLAAFAVMFFLSNRISAEQVESFTERLGPWGPVLLISMIAMSHVFAPLAGSPIVLAGIKLYGYTALTIMLYTAGLISATINFSIARRFGRSWVKRLVGKNTMKQIDEITLHEEDKLLIMSRLFGFSIFEVISYAFGLTAISFRRYMVFTVACSFVPSLIGYFVYRNVDFNNPIGFASWVIGIGATGVIFTTYLFGLYRKGKAVARLEGNESVGGDVESNT